MVFWGKNNASVFLVQVQSLTGQSRWAPGGRQSCQVTRLSQLVTHHGMCNYDFPLLRTKYRRMHPLEHGEGSCPLTPFLERTCSKGPTTFTLLEEHTQQWLHQSKVMWSFTGILRVVDRQRAVGLFFFFFRKHKS